MACGESTISGVVAALSRYPGSLADRLAGTYAGPPSFPGLGTFEPEPRPAETGRAGNPPDQGRVLPLWLRVAYEPGRLRAGATSPPAMTVELRPGSPRWSTVRWASACGDGWRTTQE